MSISGFERKLQLERARSLRILVACVFAALAGRLWYLQIAMGNRLLEESKQNSRRLIRAVAPRGMVLDRNGKVLAGSRPQFIVTAVPELLRESPFGMRRLERILDISENDLRQILEAGTTSGAPVRVAVDVPMEIVAGIKEQADMLPGVEVSLDQARYYPDGPLCAHIFGYLGEIDEREMQRMPSYPLGAFVGKAGIEKRYERELRGSDGGKWIEVDAAGRLRRVMGNAAPQPGSTLVLAIDKFVQKAAEEGLRGKTGAAVAIDPRNGDVLALVSKPDFDPNIFVGGVLLKDWRRIVGNKKHPLQNRAIANKYPPGSTFKVITMTAGMRYGKVQPNMRVVCGGAYHMGRKTFHCWGRHGVVDPIKAVAQSCDVFFYTVGRAVGINRLAVVAREFGVDKRTGIDTGGETKGTVPDEQWKREHCREKNWYPGETVVCSIGQGYVQATPIRMALVAAAIGNGGIIYQPHIVKRVTTASGRIVHLAKPRIAARVAFEPKQLAMLKEGLRQAVQHGTAKAAGIPGIEVCGKTGTAQDPPRPRPHAWFICFAPREKPSIAICVFAEGGGHGGSVSAPVARKMLEAWFHKSAGQSQAAGRTD